MNGRNRATANLGVVVSVLVSVLVLCAAGGCSSNALIKRRRDLPVEAEILGGSVDNVYVRDSGGEATIERIDIADVDHPGTGLMVVGPGIALGIFLPIFPSLRDCGAHGASSCMGAFLPIALGAGVFAWGATTYARSVAALNDRSRIDLGERTFRRSGPRVRVTRRKVDAAADDDAVPFDGPAAPAPSGGGPSDAPAPADSATPAAAGGSGP